VVGAMEGRRDADRRGLNSFNDLAFTKHTDEVVRIPVLALVVGEGRKMKR
jgi:hypothetical protein